MEKKKVIEFVKPYYENKDIMHNMWHMELVQKKIDEVISVSNYELNYEYLILAMYFHGFIYSDEKKIRDWLKENKYEDNEIEKIVKIAWESQRNKVPETIEGKILHDAHVLEGGKTYLMVKTLITGSIRGQTLKETLEYMNKNVLNKNKCYLPETLKLCEEMNKYTNNFYEQIIKDIN
jgi:uncharacterized protein